MKFWTVNVMSGYHFSSNSGIEKTVSGLSRLMLVWPLNRYDAFSRRSISEACMASLDARVAFIVSMKSERVGIGQRSVPGACRMASLVLPFAADAFLATFIR